jgi:hypothetical protein
MKYIGRNLRALLAMAVVATLAAISIPQPRPLGAAGSAPVTVTNTPLPVQGTVGVTNFPTTQLVSGTVSVGNFPTTQNVSFSNTSAMPLHVRDVDNPAYHPFSTTVSCQVPANSGECDASFPVPAGMQLVIETVSIFAQLQSGQRPLVFLQSSAGGFTAEASIPLTFTGNFSPNSPFDTYSVTQALHLYADPNSSVRFRGDRNDLTGITAFECEIFGYTVACGSGSGCPVP